MSDSSSPSSPRPENDELPAQPFFPPAVVIRSDTARRIQVIDPDAPSAPSIYPPLAKEAVWREWNINPAKHGPEKLTRPPVFVQSKGNYDELGRSVIDGVEVDVEEGRATPKRHIEGGQSVAEWYTALSRNGSGANTPQHVVRPDDRIEVVRVSQENAIDLTADSDEEEEEVKPASSHLEMPLNSTSATSLPPLRVNRNEWFIRRALLKSHQANAASSSKPHGSTSIGSMLGVTPIQLKPAAPQYVLGPENKGYEILKDRLGWGGGGLGRPVGFVDESGPSAQRDKLSASSPERSASRSLKEELEADIAASSAIKQEEAVVDLTVDTASEAGSDLDDEIPPEGPSGPGRTVPIATSLKLDKLGLGHARGKTDRRGNSLKRVTHTHQEIIEAQRRAKYRRPERGLELGPKGKIKWKEKDKREREDRRRIAAALNG